MKKFTAILLSIIMLFTVLPLTALATEGDVPIDAEHFPDANFRTYVKDCFDTDKNDILSATEIASAKWFYIGGKGISDLTGIENFTELINLYVESNQLISLDLSKNTKLESLYCESNQLISLDVNNCAKLKYLDCNYNSLTTLDVSDNKKLETLYCICNQLTSLDISSTSINDMGKFGCFSQRNYSIITTNGVFDLSTLPKGFDVSKTSDWSGATEKDGVLTLNAGSTSVGYKYDCGKNMSCYFKLTVTHNYTITHNHTITYTPAKYSTCITQGHDGYWQCSDTTCNQLFDADGNPISAIPYRELAAHTEGTQWLNDENYHWHVCATEGCGAVIDSSKAEHADTVVKDHKCDSCGYDKLGVHADADKDHNCDYGCSETIGTCEDKNLDHKCDYGCGKEFGEHADNDDDHNCDYCGQEISKHSGGTATCNAKAICEVCLEPYGEKNPNNHVNLKQFPEKAATADEEGNIEYWYCDGCKKYFSDENGTNEIEQENIVIKKLEPDDSDDDSSGSVRMFYWLKWLLEFLNKLMTKMFNVLGWAC